MFVFFLCFSPCWFQRESIAAGHVLILPNRFEQMEVLVLFVFERAAEKEEEVIRGFGVVVLFIFELTVLCYQRIGKNRVILRMPL